MLDLKLTDSQREVSNKNFLLDLKMFRTRTEFTKFMQQIRAKIDVQIKDYYTLQSLYELQRQEIKELQTRNEECDRVSSVLRDNQIYVDISVFVDRSKDIERECNALKTDNATLRDDIRDHKQLTDQLKDINQREKSLFQVQIQALEEEKAQQAQDKMDILKDLMRLQQTTSLEQSDNVMRGILQSNEKDIKQLISDQQEEDRRKEEDKRQEEMAALRRLQEEERYRKEMAAASKKGKQPTLKGSQYSNMRSRQLNQSLNKSLNKSIDLVTSNSKFKNVEGFSETAKMISKKNSSSNIQLVKQTKYLNRSMSKKSVASRSPSKDNSMCKDRSIIILHKEINNGLTQSPCKPRDSTIIKDLLKENHVQPVSNEFLSYSQIVPQGSTEKLQQNCSAQSHAHKSFKGLSSFKYDYSKKKHQEKKSRG